MSVYELSGAIPSAEWRERARCNGVDPEIFFRDEMGSASVTGFHTGISFELRFRAAKAVCAECPVRVECLESNIMVPYGVFGGMDERERKDERRRRGLPMVAAAWWKW